MAHHFNTPEDKVIGLIIGATAGIINGFMNVTAFITLQAVMDTIMLAIIGSTFGFLTTSLLKYIRNKIRKD